MRSTLNDKSRLELIVNSIENIFHFTKDIGSFDEFQGNLILCHAVTYNVQCIGESVFKLSEKFRISHTDVDWDSIEGMRHILVHDYYRVSFKFIWNVVVDDLPVLKEKIQEYLKLM